MPFNLNLLHILIAHSKRIWAKDKIGNMDGNKCKDESQIFSSIIPVMPLSFSTIKKIGQK
jgi:hypothetical protein